MSSATRNQSSPSNAASAKGPRLEKQTAAVNRILRRAALAATLLASLFAIVAIRWTAAASNEPAGSASIAPALEVADGCLVVIPKAGLGKDYQFTASLIPQERAATSTGLAGKIVRFELFSDGVDMYESTRGLLVTEDLPARRLLASFAIVRQDGDRVVIDFNKGMRRVFTESWTEGGGLDLVGRDTVLEVPESRVFEARQDGSRLIIRQSVQARNRQSNQNLEARYEVRYFLTPYRPGAFDGKEPEGPDARYVRFFESEGQIEPVTGRVSARIARFDLRNPVVFYYSANTPANYVEAVRDGILYWNRAFGKEVVRAEKAPEGVTAPDAKYNVIQWVPWDNAGFAYADVLLDPLSGESEHGQAYITSVFAFSGRARARVLLRAMEELAAPKKDDKKGEGQPRLGVPFLASAPACQVDPQEFAQQMAHGLQEVLASDQLTDEAVLRVSQDYVREVVAHEVGHVLGLRHNFAGSLAATLTRTELNEWFRAYMTGQPLDAYTHKLASSSMMEYTILKGAVFIGWQMRTTKEPLPHDRAAIRWGYFDNEEARTNKMLFATDQDVARYGDVRQFDYGPDPVVSAYAEMAEIIDLLPNNVIETFIRARAPRNPHDRVPLEQVNLSFTSYASQLANQFADILSWFKSDTRSLRVENAFDFIGDLNRQERLDAHWKRLNGQIDQLGGVDRAAFSIMPVDLKLDLKREPVGVPVAQQLSATNLTARLEKLLASPTYMNFVGLDDKKYNFTKEERALILQRGRKCFEELEQELMKQVCQRLENAPRTLGAEATKTVSEEDIVAKLEQRVTEMAKLMVTARYEAGDTNENRRVAGKLDKGYVEVLDFKYDLDTRLAAAKMLNEKTGSFKGWADDAKTDLNNQVKNDVELALNIGHFKDFKVSLLSRPLREWYQRQQDVLALLPLIPTTNQPPSGSPPLPPR
ncbi:MAG: zinc-dependent metalloprotease [Limisphaerales bacterium]